MSSMVPSAVGRRLRRAREAAGMTTRALSTEAGLSLSCVSLIETGWIQRPRAESLDAIAAALLISFEWLCTGRGPMRPRRRAA